MVIDKIGGSGSVYGSKKPENIVRAENPSKPADQVQISTEAAKAADNARVARMAKESIDTERSEKVREIKARLENGDYNNLTEEQLATTADRIITQFTERS